MDATLRSQSFLPVSSTEPKPRDATSLAISHLSSDVSEVLEAKEVLPPDAGSLHNSPRGRRRLAGRKDRIIHHRASRPVIQKVDVSA